MKLYDIVTSIVIQNEITESDLVKTIEFLTQDNVLRSPKAFKKVAKMIQEQLDYDDYGA